MTMPARMLRLLSLLQGRREWSGAELADRLGVTGRTVRRDVDRLRELGYPVDATPGTAGGYRLASGRNLPPLLLDDDEAVAVAIGLRTAGGAVAGIEETSMRALAKLQQVLPARLRDRVATVGDATVPVSSGGGSRVDAATLAVLATACRDHELVSFDHRRRDGTASVRRVEPYRMVTGYGYWYLLAFDPDRDDWRTFRVDRITRPMPTRVRFPPRPLPADAATVVRRAITDAPYRYTGTATVRASAETVTARLQDPVPGKVAPVDATTCTVQLRADTLEPLVRDVAAFGADCTLDGPPELLDHLRLLARRLLDAADTVGR
jgi:predicted DNA-binding transcriptional regulator YafY